MQHLGSCSNQTMVHLPTGPAPECFQVPSSDEDPLFGLIKSYGLCMNIKISRDDVTRNIDAVLLLLSHLTHIEFASDDVDICHVV